MLDYLNIQFAAFLLLESIRMYHFPFAFLKKITSTLSACTVQRTRDDQFHQ